MVFRFGVWSVQRLRLSPDATEDRWKNRCCFPCCFPSSCQDDVREAFRRLGDIKVQLIKDRDTGDSRGFGFVTFSDASKAEEASGAHLFSLKHHAICPSDVRVAHFAPVLVMMRISEWRSGQRFDGSCCPTIHSVKYTWPA